MTKNLSSDMNKNHQLNLGGMCPYCGTTVATGEHMIICPKCLTPHHSACWDENGGCTTFGCGAAYDETTAAPAKVEDTTTLAPPFKLFNFFSVFGYIAVLDLSLLIMAIAILSNMSKTLLGPESVSIAAGNNFTSLFFASILIFGLTHVAILLLTTVRRFWRILLLLMTITISTSSFLLSAWTWNMRFPEISTDIHVVGIILLIQGVISYCLI